MYFTQLLLASYLCFPSHLTNNVFLGFMEVAGQDLASSANKTWRHRIFHIFTQSRDNFSFQKPRVFQKLKKELAVPTQNLSSVVRRKTSAVDKRPSSTRIGGAVVIIFGAIFSLIFVPDLVSFCAWAYRKLTNMRCHVY